jgi:hypothetical protein
MEIGKSIDENDAWSNMSQSNEYDIRCDVVSGGPGDK